MSNRVVDRSAFLFPNNYLTKRFVDNNQMEKLEEEKEKEIFQTWFETYISHIIDISNHH